MTDSNETAEPSRTVDLRPRLRVVGDQGRRGTCVAFAVTGAHEAHRTTTGGSADVEHLSEETLYWGCKQIDGLPGSGTRLSAADLALQRWGQPLEELWPYDEHRDEAAHDYAPPGAAIDAQNCFRTSLRRIPTTLESVIGELDAGRPVVVAMQVWDAFRTAASEPLPVPAAPDLLPTGHAALIAGFDEATDAILIRNSWGARWGVDGYLWVRSGLLNLLLATWAIDNTPAQRVLTDNNDPVLTGGP